MMYWSPSAFLNVQLGPLESGNSRGFSPKICCRSASLISWQIAPSSCRSTLPERLGAALVAGGSVGTCEDSIGGAAVGLGESSLGRPGVAGVGCVGAELDGALTT